MINAVLGWSAAALHWSEAMKLLLGVSLVVLFFVAPLLPTDSAWDNLDQAHLSLQNSVDQSASLVSTVDIGDAKVKGNVLSDLAPNSALGRAQTNPTISPSSADSAHLPAVVPGMAVVLYLSHEREPEGLTFRLRMPRGTHMRIAGDTWLIERDVVPGGTPRSIATVSAQLTNAEGAAVPIAAEAYSYFRFRKLNLRPRVKHFDVQSLGISIRLTYRAEE
ncbi:ABC transporter substrate-binding protein [Mycobacterium sp. D16Q13]|nr:ABC transporter substrate-binding protein [Mycobacterium sp. D16Q13]